MEAPGGRRVGVTESLDAEQLWKLTAEHSPVGMTLVSPEGRVLSANRALCVMLRCEESDLVGGGYELLTHPDDRDRHTRLFDETVAGVRETYRLTKKCLRKDGSTLWGDLSTTALRTESGQTRCLIGQLVDVSPQRENEQLLAEALDTITRQRRMAQAILDTVDVGLLLLDRDGNYEEFNRRHADLLSLAYPEGHHGVCGQLGLVYAADGVTVLTAEAMPSSRAARGEEFDDYRIWIGGDPVERRALSVSSRALHDTSGALVGAGLAYSDITELMRAIQMRDDFLASVSHELRTPLASVVGYLELLADSVELSPDTTRQVAVIQRNADRLRDLVSDLLDSAQHRTGPLDLTRTSVDLSRIAGEALEAALPSARAAGVDLEGHILDGVRGDGDPGRLRQVIDNLVSNAVKYSDAGDRVTLSLRRAGSVAVLEVEDTGIGMTPSDLDLLFTPFFRSDQARARQAPGVGLGLGICEAIMVAHGGSIETVSVLGEGTTFTAFLPLG